MPLPCRDTGLDLANRIVQAFQDPTLYGKNLYCSGNALTQRLSIPAAVSYT